MNPNQVPGVGQEQSVDGSTQKREEVVYSAQRLREMAEKYDLENPGNDPVFDSGDINRLATQQQEILARQQTEAGQAKVYTRPELEALARGEKPAPASGFSAAEIANIAASRITPKENGDLSRAAVEAAAKSAGVNLDEYRGPAMNSSVEASVQKTPESFGGDYGVSAQVDRITPEQIAEVRRLSEQLQQPVEAATYQPKKSGRLSRFLSRLGF